MFEDWKQAWREAVANFQHELNSEEDGTVPHNSGLRRELHTARGALLRLETEITNARRAAAAERESEQVCRRRETMARQIDDQETVRIAADYAERHAERASVLERKVEVLEAERALMQRDIDAMELAVAAAEEAAPEPAKRSSLLQDDVELERQQWEIQRMQRERAADERLEELKRRMR